MKKIKRPILMLIACTAVHLICIKNAVAVEFSYSIIFPDNERKEFLARDQKQILSLGKDSAFNCMFSRLDHAISDGARFERAALSCSRVGTKEDTIIRTVLVCSKDIIGNANLHLEKGSKAWVIFLSCK